MNNKFILSYYFRKFVHKFFNQYLKRNILNFPSKETLRNQLLKLVSQNSKKIFVFPTPGSPWGYLFQRPQQIALELGSKGHLVFYCVDTSYHGEPDWFVRGLHQISDNVFLFNDNYNGELLCEFSDKLVIWQYWPVQTQYVKPFLDCGAIQIYDCIDHLSTFQQYKHIMQDHMFSLKRANVVLATAEQIYNDLSNNRNDVIKVPNGVVYQDFQGTNNVKDVYQKLITQLNQLKLENPVLIGYYGAIADWIDFKLIEFCVEMNPDLCFLFVGQVYPGLKIPRHDRIIQFNKVEYTFIPTLLQYFDVAVVPFKLNDITKNTSPVKVFEYMAGGKPVVSTDLVELWNYSPVFVSKTYEEFLNNIIRALKETNNKDYVDKLKECAKENTWNKRVEQVLSVLRERNCL